MRLLNRLFCFLMVSALAALAGTLPAIAGTLYKCHGARGETVYTNNARGYSQCVTVSTYVNNGATPVKAPVSAEKKGWSYQDTPGDKPVDVVDATPARAQTGQTTDDGVSPIVEPAKPAKVVQGAVYRVKRDKGITEYTNIRPHGGQFAVLFTYMAQCVACDVNSPIKWDSTPLNLLAYRDDITKAANDFGLDEALILAVMHAESAFNPYAVSSAGAQGLMQLMPGTATDLGVANPFDATQNIRGGARYLADLLKNFKGDQRLATAAYNAGAANVQKYNGIPPFDETRVYVERVATLHQRYRKAM